MTVDFCPTKKHPAKSGLEHVRVFTGVARPGATQDFSDYLRRVAIPDLRSRPGLRSVDVLADYQEGQETFLVSTTWDHGGALRNFAKEPSRPVLSAAEEQMLASVSVRHFTRLATTKSNLSSNVWINDDDRTLTAGSVTIDLPPLEYRLLRALYDRACEPVGTDELVRVLWPGSAYARANDVRKLVFRLRRLLSQGHGHTPTIRTRTGIGYTLELP